MGICGAIAAAAPFAGYVLVAGAASVVTIGCILAAVKYILRPGETGAQHIKRSILSPDR